MIPNNYCLKFNHFNNHIIIKKRIQRCSRKLMLKSKIFNKMANNENLGNEDKWYVNLK